MPRATMFNNPEARGFLSFNAILAPYPPYFLLWYYLPPDSLKSNVGQTVKPWHDINHNLKPF